MAPFILFLSTAVNAWALSSEDVENGFYARSNKPHEIQLITSGAVALKTYLALIESAQESIELETFVIKSDSTSRLILHALMKKAEAGKRVRVLLDSYGNDMSSWALKSLKRSGAQLRYFNNSWFSFFPVDHRKLLIIDRKVVVAGGRNLSNDNFSLGSAFNRLDYTLVIRGEIATQVTQSFNSFWKSPIVTEAYANIVRETKQTSEDFLDSYDLKVQTIVESLRYTEKWMTVNNVTFVSDSPNNQQRIFVDFLASQIHRSLSVRLESPQFCPGQRIESELLGVLEKGGKVTLIGNWSLGTTLQNGMDASLAYGFAGCSNGTKKLQSAGAALLAKSRNFSSESYPLLDEAKVSQRWTSHAKLAIFEERNVLLSSYNFESVSETMNPEAGFYFEDAYELVNFFNMIFKSRNYSSVGEKVPDNL